MKSITYEDIAKLKPQIEKIAMDYGLDFFPVIFELVDYDTVSQLAAYGGFPVRYPLPGPQIGIDRSCSRSISLTCNPVPSPRPARAP